MDWVGIKQKLPEYIRKYRYAVLIVLLGLALLLIPGKKQTEESVAKTESTETVCELTEEQRLENLLCQIEGAGDVKVMLTMAAGEETIYQSDSQLSGGTDSSSTEYDTVIITDSERAQAGLIRQVNPPVYKGAVVVCEGASKATVRFSIVEAVSKVTGLSTDRISVLKMK